MRLLSRFSPPFAIFLILHGLLEPMSNAETQTLTQTRPLNNSISAVFVFGDSTVDPGNNNYVTTLFRSNFHPYGMDFVHETPTGRFTNGRLVTDFLASYVGLKEYVPPYLDPNLSVEELMTGVSFASAGTGFDPLTARLSGVIPVQKQLQHFKEYKRKIELAIGKEKTKILISKAAFLISGGTNDFLINYYGTPFRRQNFTISRYQQFILHNFQQFVKGLIDEGAGLIALVGLPPMGCLPIVITLTDPLHRSKCNESLSHVALDYNDKLQNMLKTMNNHGTQIVYADIYQPLSDMIHNPSQFGFNKVNTGCCGSGLVEATFLCNPISHVCSNASQYVFFDSVHPTEAAYSYIFKSFQPLVDSIIKNY